MRKILLPIVASLPVLAGGCVAKTAFDVVTLPVRAAGKAVDLATTSSEEADRNYGKKMRKREAREGRERREYEKKCRKNPDCGPYDGYRANPDY